MHFAKKSAVDVDKMLVILKASISELDLTKIRTFLKSVSCNIFEGKIVKYCAGTFFSKLSMMYLVTFRVILTSSLP